MKLTRFHITGLFFSLGLLAALCTQQELEGKRRSRRKKPAVQAVRATIGEVKAVQSAEGIQVIVDTITLTAPAGHKVLVFVIVNQRYKYRRRWRVRRVAEWKKEQTGSGTLKNVTAFFDKTKLRGIKRGAQLQSMVAVVSGRDTVGMKNVLVVAGKPGTVTSGGGSKTGPGVSRHDVKRAKRDARRKAVLEGVTKSLGMIGQIKISGKVKAPTAAAEKKKFAVAKTHMEKNEKQLHAQVQSRVVGKARTQGQAKLKSSGDTQIRVQERKLKAETTKAKTQAKQKAQAKGKTEGKQAATKSKKELEKETKTAEAEVEKKAEEEEKKIEEASKGNDASKKKGACASAKQGIEALHKKGTDKLKAVNKKAKEAAKKKIEAAFEKLKEETSGRITKKAEAAKEAVKKRVEAEAEKLKGKYTAQAKGYIKKGTAAAVAKCPPNAKKYAAQMQGPVNEKLEKTAEGHIEEAFDGASEKIQGYVNGKIDGLAGKLTGPIDKEIEKYQEAAIQEAYKMIDQASAPLQKQLDSKKAWALKKVDVACKKAGEKKAEEKTAGGGLTLKLLYDNKKTGIIYLQLDGYPDPNKYNLYHQNWDSRKNRWSDGSLFAMQTATYSNSKPTIMAVQLSVKPKKTQYRAAAYLKSDKSKVTYSNELKVDGYSYKVKWEGSKRYNEYYVKDAWAR